MFPIFAVRFWGSDISIRVEARNASVAAMKAAHLTRHLLDEVESVARLPEGESVAGVVGRIAWSELADPH